MKLFSKGKLPAVIAPAAIIVVTGGCLPSHAPFVLPPAPPALGYASDPIWQIQDRNGEASDFVIYDHEFTGDTHRLNAGGEDHVKQIAARLAAGHTFPVIVERSERAWRLGPMHAAIMKVLWEKREASVDDVQMAVPAELVPPHLSIDDVLHKMETRGLAKHRVTGLDPLYRATVPRTAIVTVTGAVGGGSGDEPGFPVHLNPQLDMERRDIVVKSLVAFGIDDADSRVVVAPAMAEGFDGSEAERAYHRGLRGGYGSGAGFGGGVGGGFGF